MPIGPVDTTKSPYARWRTVPLDGVLLQEGFWSQRQEINRNVSLLFGYAQLEKSGNFNNLRLAAGTGEGEYRTPMFMDSDIYKWLEAVGYELAANPNPELEAMADKAIDLLEAAQADDGYLDSYWQVVKPDQRWSDIEHGHELYCAGHLFQAAVAYARGTSDLRLLGIACRVADNIDSVFGPDKRHSTPGHPEIEMGLIELYRETGEKRYLDLGLFFLDERGKGHLKAVYNWTPTKYYQDHVPVREASTMEGHAVRQLYLTAGVTDAYLETGEQALFDAMLRQWHDMTERKMYITGGLGALHQGEAFGEPYELPNDSCYCETCAQIASIMWSWRMLMATGESRYADLLEKTLYNGFLSGISLDGQRYFYVNPLLSRGPDRIDFYKVIERPEWYGCACCPPNVMRLLASLSHYFTSTDESGIQIHQYAPAKLDLSLNSGASVQIDMQANFPWDGAVKLSVDGTDGSEWTLRMRVPSWCEGAVFEVNGVVVTPVFEQGYATLARAWQPGDIVDLDMAMKPVLMTGHPRVDEIRGAVAIQRGPLVYCLEEVDQDATVDLLDVQIDANGPLVDAWNPDLLGGVVTVEAVGSTVDLDAWAGGMYRPYATVRNTHSAPLTLRAIPYYAWANRGANAMRVWLPKA